MSPLFLATTKQTSNEQKKKVQSIEVKDLSFIQTIE